MVLFFGLYCEASRTPLRVVWNICSRKKLLCPSQHNFSGHQIPVSATLAGAPRRAGSKESRATSGRWPMLQRPASRRRAMPGANRRFAGFAGRDGNGPAAFRPARGGNPDPAREPKRLADGAGPAGQHPPRSGGAGPAGPRPPASRMNIGLGAVGRRPVSPIGHASAIDIALHHQVRHRRRWRGAAGDAREIRRRSRRSPVPSACVFGAIGSRRILSPRRLKSGSGPPPPAAVRDAVNRIHPRRCRHAARRHLPRDQPILAGPALSVSAPAAPSSRLSEALR